MFKHLFIFALAVAALPSAHLISHALPKSTSGLRRFITATGGGKSFVSPFKGDAVLYLKKVYVAVGFKLQNHARASGGSGPVSSVTANDNRKRFKSFI
jgi:hypothetical protein